MKYGKIINGKIALSLEKDERVIAQQGLKPIFVAPTANNYPIQYYAFTESDDKIEVSDQLTPEAEIIISERKAQEIRRRRQTECFAVVNRGKVWYDSLSSEQAAELADWYNAWLDAPATGIVPDKPSWIT